jgi:hypothetical protein
MPVPDQPDRLPDLKRQRALVREHLAWLDREIAAAEKARYAAGEPPPPTESPASRSATNPELEANYQPDAIATHESTRRGCLMYAIAALALFFGTLVAIYFLRYRDHPLFFVPHSATSAPAPAPTKK